MFELSKLNTTIGKEINAGLTTFLTMVYIVIVNPVILSSVGIPFPQVFTATIIASVVGTLLMGLVAKLPIAVAPGMGLNAYFAATVTITGATYQSILSAVFVASIIFFLLSFTVLREKLIDAIPENLKYGITAGIGLFIAFIGLKSAHLVVANEATIIGLGNLKDHIAYMTLIGLAITLILMALNIPGALFIGMITTAIISFIIGDLKFDGFFQMPSLPEGLIVYNPVSAVQDVIQGGLYSAVFAFFLVTLFDTTGTLLGVLESAGLIKNGKVQRAKQAFLADSVASTIGAMFGTSPTSAYVESSAGVAAGGRSGLTAVVVAILFMITLFFAPIASTLSSIPAITSPALIIVGSLMMGAVSNIKWGTIDEAFPAFITILAMPLTGSIADGIAVGFISYPILKLVQLKFKEIHPLMYVFAILFLFLLIK